MFSRSASVVRTRRIPAVSTLCQRWHQPVLPLRIGKPPRCVWLRSFAYRFRVDSRTPPPILRGDSVRVPTNSDRAAQFRRNRYQLCPRFSVCFKRRTAFFAPRYGLKHRHRSTPRAAPAKLALSQREVLFDPRQGAGCGHRGQDQAHHAADDRTEQRPVVRLRPSRRRKAAALFSDARSLHGRAGGCRGLPNSSVIWRSFEEHSGYYATKRSVGARRSGEAAAPSCSAAQTPRGE